MQITSERMCLRSDRFGGANRCEQNVTRFHEILI